MGTRKQKEREVKEIAVVEDQSQYAGSNLPVSQSDFEALSNQRKMLKTFVANQLGKEVDYGIITGTKKNSLYKPGAEKLLRLFGLGARLNQTDKEIDRRDNYASYTYKAEVYHLKSGQVIAECEGVCTSHEKKYKTRSVWVGGQKTIEQTPIADIQNTLMKMAQKRAMVGATILAVGASDFFTQDMEDFDDSAGTVSADPEQKSQFADDERTKKVKGLIELCRKVGVSREDICRKFSLKQAEDISDAQMSECAALGGRVQKGEKVADLFSAERQVG